MFDAGEIDLDPHELNAVGGDFVFYVARDTRKYRNRQTGRTWFPLPPGLGNTLKPVLNHFFFHAKKR